VASQEEITVTVEGILQWGEFHGPPNYGENPATDRLEHWYYLQLPAPIATQLPDMKWPADFQGHDDGYFLHVRFSTTTSSAAARRLTGHRVAVTGSLEPSMIAHDRTPIVMSAVRLVSIDGWHW
jgi:hypothetical protein